MVQGIDKARVERYRTKILQSRATRGRTGIAKAVEVAEGGSIEIGGEQVDETDEQGRSDSDHSDTPGTVEATEGGSIGPAELKGGAEATETETLEGEEDHRSQTLGSDHGTNVEGLQVSDPAKISYRK